MSTETTQRRGPGVLALFPALALLMLLGAGCSDKESTAPEATAPAPEAAPQAEEPMAPAEAPEPAAEPEPQAAADESTASVDGEKIYQSSCQVCHAAGVAGAPKLGDKEAWAPRIGQKRAQRHAAERCLYDLQRRRVARCHGIHGRTGFLIVTTGTDSFRLRGQSVRVFELAGLIRRYMKA
jgi:cytochrome c5